MMSVRINCLGCCWMKKAGVIVWRCDQIECPLNLDFFKERGQKVDECFT